MFDENGNFIPVGSRPYKGAGTSAFYNIDDLLKPSSPRFDLDFDTAIAADEANKAGVSFMGNSYDPATNQSGFMNNLFGDKYMMGNVAGLASTLMQAAALPSALKQAKLQNKSLQFNLDTAKEEQGRRNRNISAFNSFKG